MDLEMPRNKPRLLSTAFGYRLVGLLSKLAGPRRVLAWLLDLDWLARRIAHEQSGVVFGEEFHNATMHLTPALVRDTVRGRTVLDVGCGIGRLSRVAAPHATRVLGIDHSEGSLAKARAMTEHGNVEFRQSDATTDVASLGRFDVALAVHLLEHIDDPVELLHALRRSCDLLIVEVPDFDFDPLNWSRERLGRRFYTDVDHVREYTVPMLTEHLTAGGWRIERLDRAGGVIVALACSG